MPPRVPVLTTVPFPSRSGSQVSALYPSHALSPPLTLSLPSSRCLSPYIHIMYLLLHLLLTPAPCCHHPKVAGDPKAKATLPFQAFHINDPHTSPHTLKNKSLILFPPIKAPSGLELRPTAPAHCLAISKDNAPESLGRIHGFS